MYEIPSVNHRAGKKTYSNTIAWQTELMRKQQWNYARRNAGEITWMLHHLQRCHWNKATPTGERDKLRRSLWFSCKLCPNFERFWSRIVDIEPYAHVSQILAICSQLDPCQSEVTTWTSKELHLINADTNMGIIWSVSAGSAVIIRSSLNALHDYSEIIVMTARV